MIFEEALQNKCCYSLEAFALLIRSEVFFVSFGAAPGSMHVLFDTISLRTKWRRPCEGDKANKCPRQKTVSRGFHKSVLGLKFRDTWHASSLLCLAREAKTEVVNLFLSRFLTGRKARKQFPKTRIRSWSALLVNTYQKWPHHSYRWKRVASWLEWIGVSLVIKRKPQTQVWRNSIRLPKRTNKNNVRNSRVNVRMKKNDSSPSVPSFYVTCQKFDGSSSQEDDSFFSEDQFLLKWSLQWISTLFLLWLWWLSFEGDYSVR